MNDEDSISKITKEFARKIAEVKDAFIMEEMKSYFDVDPHGNIIWKKKVLLRLAFYADWKRRFEQEKESIRQKLIKDLDDILMYVYDFGNIMEKIEEVINKHLGMKK